MKTKLIVVVTVVVLAISCKKEQNTVTPSILEVTTFSLKSSANEQIFNTLDAEVEENFTSKQPGFIRRESAVNENGEYVVLVYWKTLADAQASMKKFMTDASVGEYAGLIEGASMKMNRFEINADFKAGASRFVEVMTFDTNSGIDMGNFNTTNANVGKETATRKGFLQRITGINEEGKQVVVIYWDTKANSDAALQPFMNSATSKEFMGMMVQSSVAMTRSQMLTALN